MKNKKLLLPAIILAVAILAMTACAIIFSIAKQPVITEGSFDFSITYELDGEVVTINDTYVVNYVGNAGYTNSKTRNYDGNIVGKAENETNYILWETEESKLFLQTNLCPNCLMGDPSYDCPTEDIMEPQLVYDDPDGWRHKDAETLAEQGAKLISWEYPTPIENEIVFSHMSILSGEVVFPLLIIGLLALIATLIFVKKEEGTNLKPLAQASVIFNFLIALAGIPFIAITTWLFDILGANEAVSAQMLYFTSAFTALCVAASVALRRKGFDKISFFIEFAGPVSYILLLIIDSINLF